MNEHTNITAPFILVTSEGEFVTGLHTIGNVDYPLAERFLSMDEAYKQAMRFDENAADKFVAQFGMNKFRFETEKQ